MKITAYIFLKFYIKQWRKNSLENIKKLYALFPFLINYSAVSFSASFALLNTLIRDHYRLGLIYVFSYLLQLNMKRLPCPITSCTQWFQGLGLYLLFPFETCESLSFIFIYLYFYSYAIKTVAYIFIFIF